MPLIRFVGEKCHYVPTAIPVATALHSAFLPYCEPVFRRCTHLIANTLHQASLAAANEAAGTQLTAQMNGYVSDQPDKDFLIVALDLLSELAEALREFIDPLVGQSNLIHLLFVCTQVCRGQCR